MKKLLVITVYIFLFIASTGCSHNAELPVEANEPEMENTVNPFQSNDEDIGIMGSISHGPSILNVDENNHRVPWVYDGKEIYIEYRVKASGKAKNMGFFIFVDGIPQPYKVDDTKAPYEYMHTFELKEDDVDLPFTFIFSPVTGKQGETLDLTITSIYNPRFMPDMNETSSYGGYHGLLPAFYQLSFEADGKAPDDQSREVKGTINLSKEPVTNKFMEILNNNNFMQDIDMDVFNSQIFSLIYYDGSSIMDHYKINDDGTLHVTYKLCGHGGLEYTTTFYINHQPISIGEGTSIDTTIEKGSVSVIELDINLDNLEDFNTFYAISAPKNARDFPDGIFEAEKTQSILLYKKGE
ncbi:beta-glucanase/beta-glucan synthetase [Marinisporobacter balticus]|uniref:Uncharacterized protein n=1 Tax=Marinisporobacter balticus TaxID=2018667 RepID=A0A4R2KI60_9FIRM|nr:beta-glucanase/beta-glucan synthetase [Marinisporobacter balticus]TCO72162.1 hypothetical protein EV214_11925 [Marinisporobacter balticus]